MSLPWRSGRVFWEPGTARVLVLTVLVVMGTRWADLLVIPAIFMIFVSVFGVYWRFYVDDKGVVIFQLRKRMIPRAEIHSLQVARRDDRSSASLSPSGEHEPSQCLVLGLSDGRHESLMGTSSRSRSATNRLVRARAQMMYLLKMPTE